VDPLHMLENTFDRKRTSANPSHNSNPNFNPNLNSNPSPNPKAQSCFRTDKMTLLFEKVYRYQDLSSLIRKIKNIHSYIILY